MTTAFVSAQFDGADLVERGRRTLDAAFALMGRRDTTDLKEPTPYELCLVPFLEALGGVGETRRLIEALPHFEPITSMTAFRIVLANVDIETEVQHRRINRVPVDLFPFIFEHANAPMVALGRIDATTIRTLNGATGEIEDYAVGQDRKSICVVVGEARPVVASANTARAQTESFFKRAAAPLYRDRADLLVLTCVINLLALSAPFFSMFVYNNIVKTHSLATLGFALLAVVAAVLMETHYRKVRNELIASGAARLNATLLREAFSRILRLPLALTHSAPISAQNARLRQFEKIGAVFQGGLATALMDLPFMIVFLIAIGLIAGPLVLAPIALIAIFAIAGRLVVPALFSATIEAGKKRSELQTLVSQILLERETICSLGAEDLWMKRHASLARLASSARFRAAYLSLTLNSFAQFLTMMAGAVTLFAGAQLVMDGSLGIGGLVAATMLVFRAFGPVQTVFLSAHQMLSAREAVKQFDALNRLPSETESKKAAKVFHQFKGSLATEDLSFKYPGASDFALRGVTLDIPAGQMVALTGPSGAGKTTLLKMLLGLYKPMNGAVYVDGLNLLQLDASEVRASFGYMPERTDLFFGTIAQNVRLAHPEATDEEILAELEGLRLMMGSTDAPDGLNTRIRGTGRSADSMRQQIAAARALAKSAPVYLLDSPSDLLDDERERALLNRVEWLRGDATVLVVTARPETIRLCDRAIALNAGRIVADGDPASVLQNLQRIGR
ncbi:MAG: ATP-binding cassette domain-containing protein [Pseudomonadota bacterium]